MLAIRKYLFEMDSIKFGRLKVRNLAIGPMNELLKRLPDYQKRSGREVTIISSSVLCADDKDNAVDGSQLSDQELTAFAEQFIATYPRLTKVNGVAINKISRQEGESSVDYCGRVIADEILSYYERMVTVMEKSGVISAFKELNKITDMFKEKANLSVFSGLKSAADNIRSAVEDVERFSAVNMSKMAGFYEIEKQNKHMYDAIIKPPAMTVQVKPYIEHMKIPMPAPNPVYKTNEKLEDLAEQVEVFTGTLTEHLTASAVALKDVAEQIEKGSQSTNRQNNIMIGLAALSVFIAIVATYFGYRGYTMGKSASEKMQPTSVVAPADVKPRLVPPTKTTKEIKAQHITPDTKQRK